jgi:hypothetical protein
MFSKVATRANDMRIRDIILAPIRTHTKIKSKDKGHILMGLIENFATEVRNVFIDLLPKMF